jgi:hypothetical protein
MKCKKTRKGTGGVVQEAGHLLSMYNILGSTRGLGGQQPTQIIPKTGNIVSAWQ